MGAAVTPAVVIQLADADAERVRKNHEVRITELAQLPLARAKVISNVSLESGIETPVVHGLGRRPLFVMPSAPRGASSSGRIEEIRTAASTHDPAQRVVLKATGWGATITVDVLVL